MRSELRGIRDRVFRLSATLFLAILIYGASPPVLLNADTLLMTLMSLRRLTPFYWHQDRYLNVAPALFHLVSDPAQNLWCVLAFHALGLAALIAVGASLGRRLTHTSWWWSFLGLSWWTLTVVDSHTLWTYSLSAQPYAWSIVLLVVAHRLLFDRSVSRLPPNLWRPVRLLIVASITCTAVGLNPTIVWLMPTALLWLRPFERVRYLLFAVFAFGSSFVMAEWAASASGMRGDYRQLNFADYASSVTSMGEHLLASVEPWRAGAALVFLIAFWVWAFCFNSQQRPLAWRLLGLVGVGLGWFLLVAAARWVQLSGYPVRYAYACVFAAALTAILVLGRGGSLLSRHRTVRLGVCLLLVVDIGRHWPTAWLSVAEFPVMRQAALTLQQVPMHSPVLVIGDYWEAWPLVLQCEIEGRLCSAITERSGDDSPAIRQAVVDQFSRDGRVLCVKLNTSTCAQQAMRRMASLGGGEWGRSPQTTITNAAPNVTVLHQTVAMISLPVPAYP